MAELIVALDLPDAASAIELLDGLPEGCPVKVGSVLMTAAGPGFVRTLVTQGHRIFLDLKWHDIPNTVAASVDAALGLGVEMATVHALGGGQMVSAAVEAAGGRLKVVAVTALTSHDRKSLAGLLGRDVDSVGNEVVRLARIALDAGAHGLVCSPQELGLLAPLVGERRLVVPGIRRQDDPMGDQIRVADPATAVAAGATHLVVGRPITRSSDPAVAWASFRSEMLRSL